MFNQTREKKTSAVRRVSNTRPCGSSKSEGPTRGIKGKGEMAHCPTGRVRETGQGPANPGLHSKM